MRKVLGLALLLTVFPLLAYAQVRPIEKDSTAAARQAPASFSARYEGGMFGFSEKEKGTLKFEDANQRLVFLGKDGKERFAIAYDAMQVVTPQSRSVTSTTGTVVSHVPLPGAGLAGLIREKRRYLVVSFRDADADVSGSASFKVDSKELLESVIDTLGRKANLAQRGDSYYRPRVGP